MPGTGDAYDFATLAESGVADVAFSADQTRLYAAMRNGDINVYDVATRQKIATWDVGTALGAISVSPDGSFLIVVERQGAAEQSTFYRVDTVTGSAQTVTTPGQAFRDVEIVDGDTAVLTGGHPAPKLYNTVTGSFSTLNGAVSYSNNSVLVEDSRYTLFAEPGISNGPLFLFDDTTNSIVASGDNYQTIAAHGHGYYTGFNWGSQAVSEKAGLVLQWIYYGSIHFYDMKLKYLQTVQVGQPVDGLAFDPTGKYAYAYLIDSGVVAKYDVATWTKVDQFTVGTSQTHNDIGYGNQLLVSSDGARITVLDARATVGKLRIVDLTVRNERFDGTAGPDAFAGGKGDDRYRIDHPGDSITELAHEGEDTVETTLESFELPSNVEALVGLSASGQRLTGNASANVITGNAGNDVLNGAGGPDRLIGGAGHDLYYVDNVGDLSIEGPDGGNDTVATTVDYRLGAHIESLSANDIYGTAPLRLTGNDLPNYIYGTFGNNVLNGAGGADFMAGYGGHDLYYVDHESDFVYEEADGGVDRVATTVSYVLGANVENLQANDIGGTAPLSLTGNDLANNIYGTQGNNVLNGAGGADFMAGYSGHDFYYVDHEGDFAYEDPNGGIDTVGTLVSFELGANLENLQSADIYGTAALRLTGNSLSNNIYATFGDNVLNGAGGADFMVGYGGNDLYYVDHAGDVAYEDANGGIDRVVTAVSYALGGNVENLQSNDIGGTAALTLVGNDIANVIWGTNGDNAIYGRGGNDELYGYAGSDRFVFDTAPGMGNYDFLGDFQAGVDRIVLDNAVYSALADGALPASAFVNGSAAADADDRIVYNQATGGLFYDADGSGAGAMVLFAVVAGGQPIAAADFTVI